MPCSPAQHVDTVQHPVTMHPLAPSLIMHRHSPSRACTGAAVPVPVPGSSPSTSCAHDSLQPLPPLQVREAMDAASHPALLLVDGVSSIAALDFQFDNWKVDVAVTGSQKGLSLPTGLSVIAISDKVQPHV